jgi:hypothetical protein
MGRKKKMEFKLNPEWMLKEPLDFEYNKYTLLGYLQKCEQSLNNFEIYPDFVEISLHLANVQSLNKENTLLLTNKKFESCDDEIMLKDLFPKKPRTLSDDEKIELTKTLEYSNGKLYETFNHVKSMWNIAFDNIDISLKKNKSYLNLGMGYIFFYKKGENKIYVWEYQIKKDRKNPNTNRTTIKLIYENLLEEVTLTSIVEGHSSFCKLKNCKSLPVFEMQCNQEFPMEQTLVPIMKRKVMSHIFQTLNISKIKNFDSE